MIYVDINGNPRGCPVVTRSPPSRRLQDAATSYTPRSWVQILCFIESEREKLSLLLLASRCLPFCSPSPTREIPYHSSLLRFTVANGESEGVKPAIAFRVPMNFINKTTLARCAAHSYKAQTDRPVQLFSYMYLREADERGEFVRPRFSLSLRRAAKGSINRRLF